MVKPESRITTGAEDGRILRFVIPGEEGYSEFWRRDKSPVEPLELAKLLFALRKVAAFVGRNVGDVVWSGMEVGHGIALDPTAIMGRYPVPASKTDLMVGILIQEAYRRTEWSDRVKQLAKTELTLAPQYAYKFDLFFDLCERVYVDGLANRRVFRYYTEMARNWRIHKVAKELISPPTVSELMHVWWKLAADRDPDKYKEGYWDRSVGGLVERANLEKFYRAPIALLNRMVVPLRDRCPAIDGVAERGEFRLGLYLDLWPELMQHIRFWPGDRGDKFLLSDKFDEDMAREDEQRKAVKATIVSYAELIERAIPQKNVDFTAEVKDNVVNADSVVRIEGNDVVMIARNKVDVPLLRKLQLVVRQAAARRTTFSRGLRSGKIERRRLYRAHTTGAVFQLRKDHFALRNDIALLIDATGSMADPSKWDTSERIYQTLFTALRGYNRNARIFAYNEVRNACRISDLHRDGRMFTVLPHGKTASGEAIIATAINLKGRARKLRIVHITDGASNWGCGVDEAIAYCRRHGVGLLTLGIGCSAAGKQSLKEEYGRLVQFVDATEHLPRLFAALLHYDLRTVT